MRALLVLCLLLALAAPARAHKPSDSYLSLRDAGTTLAGRWDIALRDLDYALGLDADQDGAITWGELRARHPTIAAYALARLQLREGARACALVPGAQRVDTHADGAYAVLDFTAQCPGGGAPRSLDYRLFADLDPTHRGLLKWESAAGVLTAVLGPERPSFALGDGGVDRREALMRYAHEGLWHIWKGFDHLLFLLALLLPAVLWREGGQWCAAGSLRAVVVGTAGTVTAFTAAHAITLSAAALGYVELPARLVESAIAGTIVLAALANLRGRGGGRGRWRLAFGLGLIHGFGFASVLAGLGLPREALALALLGFNLGVEAAQLALVAAFLPLAYALRGTWAYRRLGLELGSLLVAATALVWLTERGLDLRLAL